ncbi:MAG: hypothetical protein SNH73_06435 [Rikenellaceae bacterium]
MRKLFTIALFATLGMIATSCSDNDDAFYVSTSGEGSIVVNSDFPTYLYRMVLFSNETEQEIYLMGNSAYVDSNGDFIGRGGVVKISVPNEGDNYQLLEQTFDIGSSEYSVSYSPYVNYSSDDGSYDFVTIESGTVLIRRSGNYYDIRLLGSDTDSDNLIITYRGYVYRWFYDDSESDTRSLD